MPVAEFVNISFRERPAIVTDSATVKPGNWNRPFIQHQRGFRCPNPAIPGRLFGKPPNHGEKLPHFTHLAFLKRRVRVTAQKKTFGNGAICKKPFGNGAVMEKKPFGNGGDLQKNRLVTVERWRKNRLVTVSGTDWHQMSSIGINCHQLTLIVTDWHQLAFIVTDWHQLASSGINWR